MAETARRMGHSHGSDVVRRLIARPIRLQSARIAAPVSVAPPRAAEAVQAAPGGSAGDTAQEASETLRETPPAIPNADRLRTEMLLLKAVLQAERRENAGLRACLGFDEADASLASDTRAMRDRWAALVDRLLHAPA